MFETANLGEATYLLAKGHPPSNIRTNGHAFVVFEFSSLSEQEALGLLARPEFSFCELYHRSLRLLRQRMDRATGQGPRR